MYRVIPFHELLFDVQEKGGVEFFKYVYFTLVGTD